MAFSFELKLTISPERYGAISAGPKQNLLSGNVSPANITGRQVRKGVAGAASAGEVQLPLDDCSSA